MWEDADHYRFRPGAERFVDFEVPVAAHLGLGVAIDHALALGIDAIAAPGAAAWPSSLRRDLATVDGVDVHDGGSPPVAASSPSPSDRAAPTEIKEAASAAGVNVSVSDAPAARLDMVAPHPTVGGAGLPPLLQHRGRAGPTGGRGGLAGWPMTLATR